MLPMTITKTQRLLSANRKFSVLSFTRVSTLSTSYIELQLFITVNIQACKEKF